ncbi:MAG: RNA polymerase sigma factor [Paludibacteraceae bacterium]
MNELEKEFEQLVKKHKTTIYTVCYMFSNDTDEVNDYFQDTLINLWRGFPQFRHESSPQTWIWRVSMNTCISADRKKRSRRQSIPLTMDINLFADNDDDSRQVQMLYDRIHRLNLIDRAIVLLWLENISYDEIGQIVGISTKNVSVRLVRIREQLKKQ